MPLGRNLVPILGEAIGAAWSTGPSKVCTDNITCIGAAKLPYFYHNLTLHRRFSKREPLSLRTQNQLICKFLRSAMSLTRPPGNMAPGSVAVKFWPPRIGTQCSVKFRMPAKRTCLENGGCHVLPSHTGCPPHALRSLTRNSSCAGRHHNSCQGVACRFGRDGHADNGRPQRQHRLDKPHTRR